MLARRLLLITLLVGGVWFVTAGRGPFSTLLPFQDPLPLSRSTAPLVLREVHAEPEYYPDEQRNTAIYKRVLPSVVNVTSTSIEMTLFYGPVPQQGQGSGFILDTHGHIVTNYHVVEDAQNVEVQLWDKRRYKARVLNKDQRHDLALLQIDAPNLQPVTLAESRDLVPGQDVYAVGNPFGLNGTMTTGIISAIRPVRGPLGGEIDNAIQTDAAINPGNSGGPLLNSHGEVIGINSLIATNPNQAVDQSAGIGFAIPIDTVKAVLSDFERYGYSRRPSLGIRSLPIGPEVAEQMGLPAVSGMLIQNLVPGGAAQQAGLRGGSEQAVLGNMEILLGGDLLVAINGQSVSSTEDISDLMDEHQVGDTLQVTFYRGKRRMVTRLTLAQASQPQG